MSRYIDADMLTKRLKIYAEDDWNANLYSSLPSVVDDCIDMIDEQPTADVVEVVRCKDCKWYSRLGCDYPSALVVANDENYCSYGERREDGKVH